MRPIIAVVYVGLAALTVSASPSTISLTKLKRTRTHPIPVVDRARASALATKHKPSSGPATVSVTDIGYISYFANVGVGSPPTYYSLIVDTGSSNTFVGASQPYVSTSTSVKTGQQVYVGYGSGSFSGDEYSDSVTLAPNLVIEKQSIGDASQSQGFQYVDGILGVGPKDLTNHTLYPGINLEIPTVMDNAFQQRLIDEPVLSVSFAPSTVSKAGNSTNGVMTIGGTDPSYYVGEITYTPTTRIHPSSSYWGIDMTVTYGSINIMSPSAAGIVDTGTTLLLLADECFQTYLQAIPGAYVDQLLGLVAIPKGSVAGMQSLTLQTSNVKLTLDPAAQLFPEEDNAGFGGSEDMRYAITNTIENPIDGLSFVLGMTVMQRYYTVFDAGKKSIGFALTDHTSSKS